MLLNLLNFDDSFEIKIDFEKESGDPSRIFRAMTGLIESIQSFDQHLAGCVSTKIQTKLLLQDIETGSLKSKLKTIIEEIPDEALRQGEVKKVIGHFLFKGKHLLLDWCSREKEIATRKKVKQLQSGLLELAEKTNLLQLPTYVPIESGILLSDIGSIKDAMVSLEEKDSAIFTSQQGVSQFNKNLVISENLMQEMIIKESIVSEGEKIVKVKKPDYLGHSKWEFKYSGHVIYAKISDADWLRDFQLNKISVQPRDSLRVQATEETFYGHNNEIVQINYTITKVKEVIAAQRYEQGDLF